ncbi:translation initiation factor IF-2-like [Corvus kubaryi]|uniref:translation initiation factor IF-2-like n=1 Tax=Corvus kubaryi TaxID=68294 RepID=UPI001C03B48B|nr:translation initiation factor IF-2-like [Corvus kubaryi]
MEPRPRWAVARGGTAAPRAAAGPRPPPEPGASGCWPGLGAVRAGEARAGRREPGQGAEPAPTLPSWRSLQLAEDRSRAAERLHQALPFVDSPQESLREAAVRFMGEPRARGPSPPRRSSAPAPAAAPAAGSGPGAVEPRLPSGPLPPSRSRALGRQDAARARAEPCRGRRAGGHGAGSAAARELCRGAVTASVLPGAARVFLRGHKEELQLLSEAIQAPRNDAGPSCSNQEIQAHFDQTAEEGSSSGSREPVSQE